MYVTLAVVAGFALVYAAIAGRIQRSALSGPMIFVAFGLVAGPAGFGVLDLEVNAQALRVLAELTLAVVLFADAANANLGVLKRVAALPARLLLIGLPLTIILGTALAAGLFPELSLIEAGILATLLAPTDAALGKAVVMNPAVPSHVREGLNFESGLNDGICVPILFVLLELAAERAAGSPGTLAATLLAEELGIGAAAGIGLALLTVALYRVAVRRDWVDEHWLGVPIAALGLCSFGLAQAVGGSGFIAAFVGGLLFGTFMKERKHELIESAELTGDVLALVTWVAFGAVVVPLAWENLEPRALPYALASLTVIRMVPIYLSLVGTGTDAFSRLFLGWFGPRGLATVVFCVILLGEAVPHDRLIVDIAIWAVILSVVVHGVSAVPLANAFARHAGAGRAGAQR